MEDHYEDIDLRIRMKLVKCKRFKTFQEDPPNRKYPPNMPYFSIHRLKLLSDDDSYLNKANQTTEQEPTIQDKDDVVIEEKVSVEETVANVSEEETASVEITEANVSEEETASVEETKANILGEETAKDDDIPEFIKAGMLRDNKRRIDIVLVVEDNASINSDCLKFDYLTNILRTGLEIEIEPGQMKIHKHLYFINIHAPDSVLNEYGQMFAVKRYFVNNRRSSDNTYCNSNETEWLKIIRSNYITPDGYSNYERSLIVYKILRHLPFGDHVNQYGLHRLLKRNIILDAYALHDGPYCYTSFETATLTNGRQILYYNWVGFRNVFWSQPLHVIHEYFGPKIAFYYSFYGFYNAALTLASIAGVVSVLMPFIANEEPDAMKQLCKKSFKKICPECIRERCPKRPMKDYCTPIAIYVHLDHPYILYFTVFMIFWALAFIMFWKRKEHVLNWIWEVGRRDSYYKISKRPEYKINHSNPGKGYKYDESGFYKVIRISLSTVLIPLCVVSSLAIMTECKNKYESFADLLITNEKPTKIQEYLVLVAFETLYIFLISVLEIAFHFICYYIVDLENHRSFNAYEKSLITKQFAFSITLMYPFICYFAWLVGNLNIYYGGCQFASWSPLSELLFTLHKWIRTPWYYIQASAGYYYGWYSLPDCYKYCWPFTCIIEVSILLIVMLFLKQVVFRVVCNIYRFKTDYNANAVFPCWERTKNISCWEREYQLKEFNEAELTSKYMIIALQFSMITFFVIAFPLAPLIVLIVNAWDIRHSARKLLLASRRPLLIRSPGIGAWNNILLFTLFVAIPTNSLTLMFTTRQNLREFFKKPLNSTLLDFLLNEHSLYIDVPSKPLKWEECYAPYLLTPSENIKPVVNYEWDRLLNHRATKNEYYWINIVSCKMVFVGFIIILFLVLIKQNLLNPYRGDIRKTMATENKIINLYSHYTLIVEKEKNKENIVE